LQSLADPWGIFAITSCRSATHALRFSNDPLDLLEGRIGTLERGTLGQLNRDKEHTLIQLQNRTGGSVGPRRAATPITQLARPRGCPASGRKLFQPIHLCGFQGARSRSAIAGSPATPSPFSATRFATRSHADTADEPGAARVCRTAETSSRTQGLSLPPLPLDLPRRLSRATLQRARHDTGEGSVLRSYKPSSAASKRTPAKFCAAR